MSGALQADANTLAEALGTDLTVLADGSWRTLFVSGGVTSAGLYLVSCGGFGPAQPAPSNAHRGMRWVRYNSVGVLQEVLGAAENGQAGSIYPALSVSALGVFAVGDQYALEMKMGTTETWARLDIQAVKLA